MRCSDVGCGPPPNRVGRVRREVVETGAANGDARLWPSYGIFVQVAGCGWSIRMAVSAVAGGSR